MKNNYKKIFSFLIICVFTSCSIDNPVEYNIGKYYGTWLWLQTEGGFFPRIITPNPGTSVKISFKYLNTFQLIRNDSLKVTANYSLEINKNNWDKISYYNLKTFDYSFDTNAVYTQIHSYSLTIWDGAFDGFFSFYKRIN